MLSKGSIFIFPVFSIPVGLEKHATSILAFFLFLCYSYPVFQRGPGFILLSFRYTNLEDSSGLVSQKRSSASLICQENTKKRKIHKVEVFAVWM
jgi:hypothetical protein